MKSLMKASLAANGRANNVRGSDVSVRVGVVEIGSRAVRLLVADISEKAGLQPLLTKAVETQLMESVRRGAESTRQALVRVSDVVSDFRRKMASLNVERSTVFGTQAMREVTSLVEFRDLPIHADVKLLDQRTEAQCSLVAAVMGRSAPPLQSVLVIDQGAGSLELASGECHPSVKMLDFVSLELGGDKLLSLLQEGKLSISKFRSRLAPKITEMKIKHGPIEKVIVQGSVSTKCAWLTVRHDKTEIYNPRRVHGANLRAKNLHDMVSLVETISPAKWADFRANVEPRNPRSMEFDQLIAGVVVLLLLLEHFDKDEFEVSAQGTRHGVAWQLAFPSLF